MRLRRLPWLFWLGIIGYVSLTALVATGVMDSIDRSVLHVCRDHHQTTLAAAARDLTDVFAPAVDVGVLMLAAAALAWRRHRPAVFVAAAAVASALAVAVLVSKVAVARTDPNGNHPEGGAFPSGHTTAFLVCWGTLTLLATRDHRRGPLAAVGTGTVLIAAALVYDGYHWLTDTLGAISLGVSLLSGFASVPAVSRRTESPSSATGTPPIDRTAPRR